jgi:hypothetical protein
MHIVASLISDLGLFILGFVIGTNLMAKAINKNQKNINRNNILPLCVIEYMEGSYYLYAEQTRKFLCQSSTIEGLAKNLRDYQKINLAFVIGPDDGEHKMFWFAGGEVRPADLNGITTVTSELK